MPISVSLFSEGHSPWCSTNAGTVDSMNSTGALLVSTRLAQKDVRMKELMAGVQVRQWESLNKGGERQKCHVSTESMFKEGRRTGWHFLFHQYSCILQVWVQLFFFWQIGGHLWLSLKRTANILLRMMKITKCFHKNGQPTSGQGYTVCLLGVQLQNL